MTRNPVRAVMRRRSHPTLTPAERAVLAQVARSEVPEDPAHALDTLRWLLRLAPRADAALRLAALGHDIERARRRRLQRAAFAGYDAFKAAHARAGARILARLLRRRGVPHRTIAEVRRLVRRHETGGDPRSNVLRDADSLSFFTTNLPLYLAREGEEEALRRSLWGLARIAPRRRRLLARIRHRDPAAARILRACLQETRPWRVEHGDL